MLRAQEYSPWLLTETPIDRHDRHVRRFHHNLITLDHLVFVGDLLRLRRVVSNRRRLVADDRIAQSLRASLVIIAMRIASDFRCVLIARFTSASVSFASCSRM